MALFSKITDPQKRAQRDLDAACANRDGLVARKKVAEAAIAEHREKARTLARDNADDAALSAAETAMRNQQDRAATLSAAISDVETTICGLEREINSIVDQKMRAETAQTVDGMVSELENAAAKFEAIAKRLEDATRASALIVLDGYPISSFILSARQQLPPAIDVLVVGLKAHAAAVLAGTARASLPMPEPEPPQLKLVEKPAIMEIVALRNSDTSTRQGLRSAAGDFSGTCCRSRSPRRRSRSARPPSWATRARKVRSACLA